MTKEEFKTQFRRLKKWCGELSMPDPYKGEERMLYFWKNLCHVPNYIFAEAVTEIVCNHQKPPLFQQILKVCSQVSEKKKYSQTASQGSEDAYESFVPDEAWIDKTNKELLEMDSNFNATGAKILIMQVVNSMRSRNGRAI